MLENLFKKQYYCDVKVDNLPYWWFEPLGEDINIAMINSIISRFGIGYQKFYVPRSPMEEYRHTEAECDITSYKFNTEGRSLTITVFYRAKSRDAKIIHKGISCLLNKYIEDIEEKLIHGIRKEIIDRALSHFISKVGITFGSIELKEQKVYFLQSQIEDRFNKNKEDKKERLKKYLLTWLKNQGVDSNNYLDEINIFVDMCFLYC